jgi:hypothetical protein
MLRGIQSLFQSNGRDAATNNIAASHFNHSIIKRQVSGFLFSQSEKYFVSQLESLFIQLWRYGKTFWRLQSPTSSIRMKLELSALAPDGFNQPTCGL